MESIFGVLILSALCCYIFIRLLVPISFLINLVDLPGGRKQHLGKIPLVGGIAIYISIVFVVFLFVPNALYLGLFLFVGGVIVFLGVLDDRYSLSTSFRLIGQTLVAAFFVVGMNIKISSFGDILGFGNIEIGLLGYILSILSLVGLVNAMNMLDGMDGIVGVICLVCFLGLSILHLFNGDTIYSQICVAYVGSIIVFLFFNLSDIAKLKKIFMGDAGSTFLGLSLGVLLIQGSQGDRAAFSPVVALWFILLPMTDMFTIMFRRLKRGKSPMAPDRTHIHHILLRAGFSKKSALQFIMLVQLFFVGVGLAFAFGNFKEAHSFFFALSFVVLYQLILMKSWKLIRWYKKNISVYYG